MDETRPNPVKNSVKKNLPVRRMIFWGVGVLLAVVLFLFLRSFVACWTLTSLAGVPPASCSTTTIAGTGQTPLPDAGETPVATSTPGAVAPVGELPEPWDGTSRVTVLIIGVDYRDWEAGEGAPRSDTMILLTLDPLTKTAGMLSIPRDLWVNIPGFDYGKINTAFSLGQAYSLPGGGPGLAMRTVEELLGVPVPYFAQIDFFAFEKFVDEINGIELDIPATIELDPVGGHNDHVFVEPGHYNFPGYLALAYARNRYTDGGDIDRANRQQQVIFAIRNRLTEPDMLPYFISRAPSLYQELSAGIHTNMPLEDALRLGMLAKDIQITSIKKGVISYDMMQQVNTTQGEALQPIPSDIRILRDEIFTTGGALGPLMVGDALTRMQAEKARVAILNGSTYEGLGARTGEYLTAQGMNVTLVGNIGDNLALASGGNFQGYTVAIDYTGKPYAMSYLAELMALTSNRVYSDLNLGSAVDVVVVLGDDWGASNPMP